jgi:hypothetical protein
MSYENALASNQHSQQTMFVNTTINTSNVTTSSTYTTMAISALVKFANNEKIDSAGAIMSSGEPAEDNLSQ